MSDFVVSWWFDINPILHYFFLFIVSKFFDSLRVKLSRNLATVSVVNFCIQRIPQSSALNRSAKLLWVFEVPIQIQNIVMPDFFIKFPIFWTRESDPGHFGQKKWALQYKLCLWVMCFKNMFKFPYQLFTYTKEKIGSNSRKT